MNKAELFREIPMTGGQSLVLRPMQPGDVPAVAALEAEVFSQPWSEQAFLEETGREERLFVVAYIGAVLAGYMGLVPALDEADITNVAVRPSLRRMGIAEQMLQTAMEWGRGLGVLSYTLEVRAGNSGAIALYEKLGFASEGLRRNFYEKPREDALIMWKR